MKEPDSSRLNDGCLERQAGVKPWLKNSMRPPDLGFSKGHSPTQDLIALDCLNAAVPLLSFPKNNL